MIERNKTGITFKNNAAAALDNERDDRLARRVNNSNVIVFHYPLLSTASRLRRVLVQSHCQGRHDNAFNTTRLIAFRRYRGGLHHRPNVISVKCSYRLVPATVARISDGQQLFWEHDQVIGKGVILDRRRRNQSGIFSLHRYFSFGDMEQDRAMISAGVITINNFHYAKHI